jgi:hypothetical protein
MIVFDNYVFSERSSEGNFRSVLGTRVSEQGRLQGAASHQVAAADVRHVPHASGGGVGVSFRHTK